MKVKYWLQDNGIGFKWQHTLRRRNKEKGLTKIVIDFYIKDAKTVIEYNGQQHYETVGIYGGEEQFAKQLERDEEVKRICEQRKLNLLIIPYTDYDHIGDILEEKLLPLIKRG